jgi:hypothetical protein
MSNAPNMYCKIYVDIEVDKGQLLDQIARAISGSIRMRTVSSSGFQVDLLANQDFDESRRSQGDDQFLFYRYYLDIEPTKIVTYDEYIESVGNLLENLWGSGCKAVAACDFERELPRSGGYRSPLAE